MKLGAAHEALGKTDDASTQYREALRLSPLMTQTVRKLTPAQRAELEERLKELTGGTGGDTGS